MQCLVPNFQHRPISTLKNTSQPIIIKHGSRSNAEQSEKIYLAIQSKATAWVPCMYYGSKLLKVLVEYFLTKVSYIWNLVEELIDSV
jgi:hypothetical protein